MIYIVFGKCGAGKSYIGRALAEELSCLHIDGDSWLTDEMQQLIAAKLPITKDVTSRNLDHLINKLQTTLQAHQGDIVLSQALFLQEYRTRINQSFGNHCCFIQVIADETVIMQRASNSDRLVTNPAYIKEINQFFEPPTCNEKVIVITNNTEGKINVLKQWENYLVE